MAFKDPRRSSIDAVKDDAERITKKRLEEDELLNAPAEDEATEDGEDSDEDGSDETTGRRGRRAAA